MASLQPVIAWDYQFAPNAQKSRNYLYATKTPFKICEQPFVLPRPILSAIGITYRRIPVLSIGKDVFCDTISFMDAMQSLLGSQGLRKSPGDRAFEAWGYRSFWICLAVVPSKLVTKELATDRADLFEVFSRTDFADLRQNAFGELRSLFDTAENEFLTSEGSFIGGANDCGMADIHAIWMIKWAVQTVGVSEEPQLGEKFYPRVWRWINSLQNHDGAIEKDQKISQEEAKAIIMGSQYAVPDIGFDANDPVGLKPGDAAAVEATDAQPGKYPQKGRLVGLSARQAVLEMENGLRVHFPRVGYTIKQG
ncbi:Hypothetical protein R9X50_00234900 [Acrodontium crateriforme]|uniref:DUF7962 domain-containing protein n=1 Tax=Acrodontium crateriforme TaxID=150365 RepID=A0AAQ3R6K2_9PEZI|nr:Hypothetical protein R9X50_00234900 [Acrodontium crateriforme]